MIGFKVYRSTSTTLDLDGPILSYTQQPTGITTEGSSVTLVGIATALPVGTGSVSYQWYETGYGAVSTSSTITGTATTALTLNELNYNDTGREFYLQASYEASAYGTDPVTAGTARSTGNAINAPLVSDTATITIGPTIIILQQPKNSTVSVNNNATFSVLASIGSSTGAGVPSPCIAVIDESSPTQQIINQDWENFRNKWPNRAFNIFQVQRFGGEVASPGDGWWGLKLPSTSPIDYTLTQIHRDYDPDVSQVEDWFALANLDNYVAGTTVTLWVDNSGSMTANEVKLAYDKFVTRCAAAGILIEYKTSNINEENDIQTERYIWPFIDKLVGTGEETVDPNLVYQWKVNGENPVNSTTRTVSGSSSRILTINDTVAGIHTVACSLSYEGANNSPLLSNVVTYDAAGADVTRSILNLEEFDVNADLYSTKVVNLEDEALEIIPSTELEPTGNWNRIYSINAPEEDVEVKITMKGAAGAAGGTSAFTQGGHLGGEGGVSIWTMTLKRQQEYVVNLGAAIWPSGGKGVGNAGDGGGGSFFYEGGELLVACGGGGGAKGVNGGEGSGEHGYSGGVGPQPVLTSDGFYPGDLPTANTTAQNSGQVSRCTIGDYWATQGIAPCVSIGSTTFFTGKDGQKSTSTFNTPVIRGYKAGLNYQFNGGNGAFNDDGGGGGGAKGGNGGNGGDQIGRGGEGFAAIPIDQATISGNEELVGTIKIEKA